MGLVQHKEFQKIEVSGEQPTKRRHKTELSLNLPGQQINLQQRSQLLQPLR